MLPIQGKRIVRPLIGECRGEQRRAGWGLTGPQGSQNSALPTCSSCPGTENKDAPHDEGGKEVDRPGANPSFPSGLSRSLVGRLVTSVSSGCKAGCKQHLIHGRREVPARERLKHAYHWTMPDLGPVSVSHLLLLLLLIMMMMMMMMSLSV